MLLSISQAMQSSANGKSMWKAHCWALMGLGWFSRPWSLVTSTDYWLQSQTTYDQYTRALKPLPRLLQFHWSRIVFHKRLQKWSLGQLAGQPCTGNFNEQERVLCECLILCYFHISPGVFFTEKQTIALQIFSLYEEYSIWKIITWCWGNLCLISLFLCYEWRVCFLLLTEYSTMA